MNASSKAKKICLIMAGAGLIISCTTTQANDNTRTQRDRNQLTDTTDRPETVQEAQAQGKTADQQSNAENDVELTRMIRQALVADESLSTNAHNVKIITTNGNVVLKGLVNSTAEKAKVARIAQSAAKTASIDNQLAITKK